MRLSNEHAWVDIKGVLNIFITKDVWKDRSKSCQTVPIPVTSEAYDAISTDTSIWK